MSRSKSSAPSGKHRDETHSLGRSNSTRNAHSSPKVAAPKLHDEEYETQPSKIAKFFCYMWKFCSVIFSHFVMICMVVAYCILGAFTFEHLESDHEKTIKRSISKIRGDITEGIWDVTNRNPVLYQTNWTTDVLGELKRFETNILTAMKQNGWDGIEDESTIQWTFTGSLFYSIIVITTIGYGHIAPKTHMGKVVTIFYAIIGIPLMLLCLSNIGDVMATSFRFLYWRVCCYVCTRKPKKKKHRTRQPQRAASRSVRARATSTRRRPATRQPSPTYYSDTECRAAGDRMAMKRSRDPARKSDSSTAPPGYRSRSQPGRSSNGPGRGMSQPPQRFSSPPREYRRTRSHHRDSRSPVLFNRYARDYEEDDLQDKAAASLRIDNIYDIFSGLDASDYDNKYSTKWDNNRSKSLPRPQRDRYMAEEEGRRHLSEKGAHRDRAYDTADYRRNQRTSREYSNKHLEVDNRSEQSFDDDEFSKYCRDLDADYKVRNSNKYSSNYDNRYRYDRSPNRRPVRRTDSREDVTDHYRSSRSPERRRDVYGEENDYRGRSRGRRDRYHSDKEEDDDDDIEDVERRSRSNFNRSDKYHGPSARIMSPMGFHVSRQSRLMDNFDIEYINDDGQSSTKSQIKPVPIWLCVFLVISYIVAGAFLFHNWEHWSLLDSAYFCFITLTTIGFGDFVPAQGVKSNSEISIALCSLYLLFGISLLAMSFNLVQEEVIANVRSVAKRLGIIKPDGEDSEDD